VRTQELAADTLRARALCPSRRERLAFALRSAATNDARCTSGQLNDPSLSRLTTNTRGPIVREDLRGPFLDDTRDVVKRGARNRFCYTAPLWPRADLQIVAWIHPLNLASAVLSFKLQVFGRVGHHVAGFWRSPRRRQGSRFARPAFAGSGFDDDSVERTNGSYVMAG
jgi:hypothetical protein